MNRNSLYGLCMVAVLVSMTTIVVCLDNGMALTPPMGWCPWAHFKCNINCTAEPDNCLSERLLKQMADIMVQEGYREAGYKIVTLDDCWMADTRDDQGKLRPDPNRFPSGVKALADYMHERGLLLGLYGDVGKATCKGYPGSQGHMTLDAQTFADWGVDFLKLDGCSSDEHQTETGYIEMAHALNKTGHRIIYSCEWPMYAKQGGLKVNLSLVSETCNMARQLTDIHPIWSSVINMINYWGKDEGHFSWCAGPGFWNDPDQLMVGLGGLSYDQERATMAMWAIMAAPLLATADLRSVSRPVRDLMLNPGAIAVNQDPKGIQGKRVYMNKGISVWTRPIEDKGTYAVAILNSLADWPPKVVNIHLINIGLNNTYGYMVEDIFNGTVYGHFMPKEPPVHSVIAPSAVHFVKAVPVTSDKRMFKYMYRKTKSKILHDKNQGNPTNPVRHWYNKVIKMKKKRLIKS